MIFNILGVLDQVKGIPEDIMSKEKLVSNLPVIFRTLRGEPPTEEELVKLADNIRKARTKKT